MLAITATLGKALTTPHLLETTPTPPEIVHRAPVTFPQEPVIAAVFPGTQSYMYMVYWTTGYWFMDYTWTTHVDQMKYIYE